MAVRSGLPPPQLRPAIATAGEAGREGGERRRDGERAEVAWCSRRRRRREEEEEGRQAGRGGGGGAGAVSHAAPGGAARALRDAARPRRAPRALHAVARASGGARRCGFACNEILLSTLKEHSF